MELRQLRYFVYVAEHGSISHAARLLHVAQPALTKQIHNLEDELRVTLFERSSRGVVLTHAGQQFLLDAKKLIGDIGSAKKKAQMASQGQIGTLSVGVTVAHCWLKEISDIFKIFRYSCPTVSVSLTPLLSSQQLNMLRSHELDVGFLFDPPDNDNFFEKIKIYDESLVLVAPQDSILASNKIKKLSELNGQEFVWFPRQAAPSYYDRMIHTFNKSGFLPHIVQEGRDTMMILTLVAAGLGCSIVPATVKSFAPKNIISYSIKDLDLKIPLYMVWRRSDTSPVLNKFIKASTEVML